MDWGQLSNILLAVLTVAVVIVGGVLGLQQGIVRTLRESNTDLRARVTDLENGREADKELLAEKNKTITEQGATIDVLTGIVTGEVHWVALTDLLENHHSQAETHWVTVETALARIAEDRKS